MPMSLITSPQWNLQPRSTPYPPPQGTSHASGRGLHPGTHPATAQWGRCRQRRRKPGLSESCCPARRNPAEPSAFGGRCSGGMIVCESDLGTEHQPGALLTRSQQSPGVGRGQASLVLELAPAPMHPESRRAGATHQALLGKTRGRLGPRRQAASQNSSESWMSRLAQSPWCQASYLFYGSPAPSPLFSEEPCCRQRLAALCDLESLPTQRQ